MFNFYSNKTKLFLTIIALIFLSFSMYSNDYKYSKDTPVDENGVFNDDYFFSGNTLNFNGNADDIYFAGNTLKLNGKTKAGVNAVGKYIFINGIVNNNLTALGDTIEINGTVNGTILIAASNITISKTAVINGTIIGGGGNFIIQGKVNGDIITGCKMLTINNEVTGNIKTGCGNIILNENAKIKGNFIYSSAYELSSLDKEKISGQIKFTKMDNWKNNDSKEMIKHKKGFMIVKAVFKTMFLISFIIFGLLLLLFPLFKKLEEDERVGKKFWFTCLWGLIPFFIYPIIGLILLVLVITIPLAFIVLLCGLPILMITQVIGVILFGKYLFNIFKWNNSNRYLLFLFGLIFFAIFSYMPIISGLTTIFFSSLGWGLILEKMFNKKLV